MNEVAAALLIGRDVSEFTSNARFFDSLEWNGERIHTAIRYGLSQALLDATAKASARLKVEVICDEYGLPIELEPLSFSVKVVMTDTMPSTR